MPYLDMAFLLMLESHQVILFNDSALGKERLDRRDSGARPGDWTRRGVELLIEKEP